MRRRANEYQSLLRAALCEFRVLAQEPVPWVDAVAAIILRGLNDLFDVKVCGWRANIHRVRRYEGVLGVAVRISVDCCRSHTGQRGGSVDTEGDFTSVSDEYIGERLDDGCGIRKRRVEPPGYRRPEQGERRPEDMAGGVARNHY